MGIASIRTIFPQSRGAWNASAAASGAPIWAATSLRLQGVLLVALSVCDRHRVSSCTNWHRHDKETDSFNHLQPSRSNDCCPECCVTWKSLRCQEVHELPAKQTPFGESLPRAWKYTDAAQLLAWVKAACWCTQWQIPRTSRSRTLTWLLQQVWPGTSGCKHCVSPTLTLIQICTYAERVTKVVVSPVGVFSPKHTSKCCLLYLASVSAKVCTTVGRCLSSQLALQMSGIAWLKISCQLEVMGVLLEPPAPQVGTSPIGYCQEMPELKASLIANED